MKTKAVVIGLIENDEQKFLISQRYEPKIKEADMKWDFVGGTIDFGETPQETLKREVMEESGLNVGVGEMLPMCYSKVWEHDDYKVHAIVLCYKCKLIGGELKIGDYKINDLKWVGKNEFKNYDFLPSINLFLEKINFFEN
ncbi:MAG: NUDIX domain-containing protein [Parcubacteria group bacterium]|jgi:8-oxo-dGTP diphosphatase